MTTLSPLELGPKLNLRVVLAILCAYTSSKSSLICSDNEWNVRANMNLMVRYNGHDTDGYSRAVSQFSNEPLDIEQCSDDIKL